MSSSQSESSKKQTVVTVGKKIDAGTIAQPFRDEVKVKVNKLKEFGIEAPLLVGILANKDPAALKYAEWTGEKHNHLISI